MYYMLYMGMLYMNPYVCVEMVCYHLHVGFVLSYLFNAQGLLWAERLFPSKIPMLKP